MRLLHSVPLLALALATAASAQRPTPRNTGKPVAKDTVRKEPPKPAPELPKFAYLQGVALDSIHGEPLAGAVIQVEGTNRITATDSLGRFLIDSILPGRHRLLIDHALLDTLGIQLMTDTMSFLLDQVTRTKVAIPDPARLTALFCPAARRTLGPGALVGRIREPDTEEPAVGARVSFVYYDPDPPGLPANLKIKKSPRVRETTVTADGTYRICGLPETFEGKLQAQRKDGGATAEVTVSQTEGVLALRSMSVSALPKTIAKDSTGAVAPIKGSARIFGKVTNANGAPVVGARVGVMGASSATKTRLDGSFVLDSLPSGTQAVVVRQLGYKPMEQTVELSARSPARVAIKLGVFVPELTPVEVMSRRDEGLNKVGFLERKRNSAGGHFITADQIEKRNAILFTDLLRTTPGIKVTGSGMNMTVSSTRTAGDGCVTFYVDGAPWQQIDAGDLDSFVKPGEVAAIEVYGGVSAPAQFTQPGTSCAAIVVWTKTRVDNGRR